MSKNDLSKTHVLQNDHWKLSLLPNFGCYWTDLHLKTGSGWFDLLDPVKDYDSLFSKQPSLGSYLMAPWANRIANAVFKFDGTDYHLRPSFPDQTAIHGDVRHRPWEVVTAQDEKFEAALDSRHFTNFNSPFDFVFKHTLSLSANVLNVGLTMQNVSHSRAIAGFGFHPFFKRQLTGMDKDIILVLPAETYYPQENCIPKGEAVPVTGKYDLRSEKFLGMPDLDHCFTDLSERKIKVIYPGSGVEIDLNLGPEFSHVVIYAPNEHNIVRDFIAVEPQTHVPDGFNLYARGVKGTGVKEMLPGETFGASWQISFFLNPQQTS